MPVVVGRIEPHVFGPGEVPRAFEALRSAEPELVSQNQATLMARAAQSLWTALRDSTPGQLEDIARNAPELGKALLAVREVMAG